LGSSFLFSPLLPSRGFSAASLGSQLDSRSFATIARGLFFYRLASFTLRFSPRYEMLLDALCFFGQLTARVAGCVACLSASTTHPLRFLTISPPLYYPHVVLIQGSALIVIPLFSTAMCARKEILFPPCFSPEFFHTISSNFLFRCMRLLMVLTEPYREKKQGYAFHSIGVRWAFWLSPALQRCQLSMSHVLTRFTISLNFL